MTALVLLVIVILLAWAAYRLLKATPNILFALAIALAINHYFIGS